MDSLLACILSWKYIIVYYINNNEKFKVFLKG